MIKKSFYGVFLFLCLIANATASEDRALFWKVESGTATVYLLGSIHFADKSFYPLRKEIERAFRSSEYLVVEMDADNIDFDQYKQKVSKDGSYAGKDTIKNHLSAGNYKKLTDYLKKLGVPLKSVEKLKPGMLVMTLTSIEVMRLGLDPSLGIDVHFLRQARENKKIIELETLDEQLAIFLDFPDGELILEEMFYSLNETEKVMDEIVTSWKEGNNKRMNKIFFEDALSEYPAFTSLYENLFYKRNVKMTNAIKGFLKKKGKYFVVVGAGHLIGDKGIVRLLEKSNYKPERL